MRRCHLPVEGCVKIQGFRIPNRLDAWETKKWKHIFSQTKFPLAVDVQLPLSDHVLVLLCTSRLLKKARTKSEFCNGFVQFINVPQCLFIFDVVFLGIWFLWIKKQIVPFSSFFLLAAQTIGSYDKYAFWVSILFLYFFLKFLLEAFSSPFIRTVILCNVLDSVICNTVLFQSVMLNVYTCFLFQWAGYRSIRCPQVGRIFHRRSSLVLH